MLVCYWLHLVAQFVGTTIHHALCGLQLVHKSLCLPLIPGKTKGGFHGIIISLDACDKTLEFRDTTPGSFLHPGA